MAGTDLILFEEEYARLTDAVTRLQRDAGAISAFMIDRSGQPIASAGAVADVDATSLASLTAGNVAATEGLAQLIGERQFSALFHEGETKHMHMTLVAGKIILVIVFDERSSLGLVRLRVRKASAEFVRILDAVGKKADNHETRAGFESPFAEITDDDIDNLFAD